MSTEKGQELSVKATQLKERLERLTEVHNKLKEEKDMIELNFNKVTIERDVLDEGEKSFRNKIRVFNDKLDKLLEENLNLKEERHNTSNMFSKNEGR